MPVKATCPSCSTSSKVPDEAVGRKVRCKKCQTAFVVEDATSEPASVSDANPFAIDDSEVTTPKRPGSKANLSDSKTRAKSKANLSESDKSSKSANKSKTPQKSNSTLWIILGVVGLLVLAGVGGGVYWATLGPEPVKSAKAKTRREEPLEKPAPKTKDAGREKEKSLQTALAKDPPTKKGANAPNTPKTPPVGEEKVVKPADIAPLAMTTALEWKELTLIRALLPVANHPHKIGVHIVNGKDQFFEMYDLKKHDRIAKIKLDSITELLDVDPDGTMLATATREKKFNIYGLPEGALLEDEWAPYDNIKDEQRFLSSGKVETIAALAKNKIWVVTSHGYGDLWELPAKKLDYPIPVPERTEYRKPAVSAHRDFVLSPDRTLFALASDEGIEIHDAVTGKKTGCTPKLSKYGSKPELVSMAFEPGGGKLAVYFSANKDAGRPFFHARFSVPAGEELLVESSTTDPGDDLIDFVTNDYFMALDRRSAELRDGKGQTVAECRFARGTGLFAPKLVQAHLAFAYVNEKNQPALGVVRVPLGGDAPVVVMESPIPKEKDKDAPPPAKTDAGGGSDLAKLFAPNPANDPPPAPKTPAGKGGAKDAPSPEKTRTFESLEIWEFGHQGIVRKGIKTFATK